MSPAIANPIGDNFNELWAGKSRNAKAQARHRAKRKAYIEQLEQTVSKLQTALALSADDVANLPTTQAKMRELKEENDSLRAEIRKLQAQPPAPDYVVPPIQMHSPPLSDEYPRRSKRRKMSPPPAEDYPQRNSYLAPVDPLVDALSASHSNYSSLRSLGPPAAAPTPLQRAVYQLQPPSNITQQPSPVDPPVPQQSREVPFLWTSFSGQVPTNHVAAPTPWSFPNHRRSSSGSSSSSESSPTYLTPHTPMQMSLGSIPSSYKSSLPNDHQAMPREPTSKGFFGPDGEVSNTFTLPSEPPVNAGEPTHGGSTGSSQHTGGTWSDISSWSYSAVRLR